MALVTARRGVSTGTWAIALLIASETALFGTLIGTWFYLHVTTHPWPPPGVPAPHVALPLAMTGVLLLSVLPVWRGWLVLATLLQGAYLGVQIASYVSDLHHFGVQSGAYASVYFTMLIIDHAHVAMGLALNVWVIARRRGGHIATWYWAFVALASLAITVTQASAA